jgi:large subunit ribosomal protein L20
MPRVKRGTIAHKKREKILKKTKGFSWGRKNKERAAKEALLHGMRRSFAGRKQKKRNFRSLWTVQINAGARIHGTTYSKLIAGMAKHSILIDRKILSDLAQHEPLVFAEIVKKATS